MAYRYWLEEGGRENFDPRGVESVHSMSVTSGIEGLALIALTTRYEAGEVVFIRGYDGRTCDIWVQKITPPLSEDH